MRVRKGMGEVATDNRTDEQIILDQDTALADAVNPEEQARELLAALHAAGRLGAEYIRADAYRREETE